MLILGIDDSGRGPIIGPMVVAGCLMEEKDETKLKKLGVKDSKLLSRGKREYLVTKIKEICLDYEVIRIHPEEIDGRNRAGTNLNKIEAVKMAEIINRIISKNKIEDGKKIKVIIDCPSVNIARWSSYLEKFIEKNNLINLVVEHKADKNHIVCSAASILAKITRDEEVEKIKKMTGIDFGSGYPSDPITQDFLKNHSHKYENHGIFRKSWQTWKDIKKEKQQRKLLDF